MFIFKLTFGKTITESCNMTDKSHDIHWTPEKIASYWDYISANTHFADMYFTKHSGLAVARDFVKTLNRKNASILDFGCGPGNLFASLTKVFSDFKYSGIDFSKKSIEIAKKAHASNKNFVDAFHISSFPIQHEKKYGHIICCEVIEHLDDHSLHDVTQSFYDLLIPGGILYITTPNDENLDSNKLMCPDCGCIYHPWQHMRSWSKETIKSYFESNGFETIKIKEIYFDNSNIMSIIKFLIKKLIMKKKATSLVYVGRKKS